MSRKPSFDYDEAYKALQEGTTVPEVMKRYDISYNTLRRAVKIVRTRKAAEEGLFKKVELSSEEVEFAIRALEDMIRINCINDSVGMTHTQMLINLLRHKAGEPTVNLPAPHEIALFGND